VPEERPTWLVTGAAGFLGVNLGSHLDGRVHRVGVGRTGSPPTTHYDEWINADLADAAALALEVERRRPDVVIHAAAMASHEACESDPVLAELVNSQAVAVLSASAQRAGSRFVLISTDAVFDGARGHYSEADEPSPFSVYGRTKLAGEQLALMNPDALVVRTNFFGWSPSGRRSILEFFVNELEAGRGVRGFTDFTVTSAYAPALCGYLERLVRQHVTGVLHLTSPDALTKYAFGVATAEEFGLDAGLITAASADVHPPRNRDLSLDVSRAEALLGSPLMRQRDGIAQAHADADVLRARVRT
jgi:dTDP-4-dehydrorhamnose reductase